MTTIPSTRVAADPDRNLALELVRATEAAAINCSRLLGFGDKNAVDAAAVDAMRPVLGSVRMNGVVVIGEGEKDEAPMLYNGERVGDGSGPEWDIAVDPVDGTTLTAKSLPDAVSVLGVSPRGTMFSPGPAVYMHKLVVPGYVADQVDLDSPLAVTLGRIAAATDRLVPGSGSCSTVTWPARSWPSPPALASTCWSASAAPRKAYSPPAPCAASAAS